MGKKLDKLCDWLIPECMGHFGKTGNSCMAGLFTVGAVSSVAAMASRIVDGDPALATIGIGALAAASTAYAIAYGNSAQNSAHTNSAQNNDDINTL